MDVDGWCRWIAAMMLPKCGRQSKLVVTTCHNDTNVLFLVLLIFLPSITCSGRLEMNYSISSTNKEIFQNCRKTWSSSHGLECFQSCGPQLEIEGMSGV
jgi:hypothetical protein